jgi:hypothetical protein
MPTGSRSGRLALGGALAAVVLAGCGSAAPSQLSRGAADELRGRLDSVSQAAQTGDRELALRELSRFSRLVDREAAAGNVPADDLRALRTGISRARRRIEVELHAPAASTPVPTPESTPAPEPAQPKRAKKGKEPGEPKGRKGKKR